MNDNLTIFPSENSEKTILFIDDEKMSLDCYSQVLKKYDYNVVIAKNGFDALKQIGMRKFDLIVTDIRMPNMDGFQLIAYIKVNIFNAETPIIAFSGVFDSACIKQLYRLGVTDYIEKTGSSEALLDRIGEKLYPISLKYEYNPEAVRIFRTSVDELMRHYFEKSPVIEGPDYDSKNVRSGIYYGVIPVFGGPVFGSIAIFSDDKLIRKFAEMLYGRSFDETETCKFVNMLGEIANELTGILKKSFLKLNMTAIIGLPETGMTEPGKSYHKISSKIMSFNVKVDEILCRVEFCFGNPEYYDKIDGKTDFRIFVH
ncbi:MAG: response regulator [Oligoflexales bacterium]|nr:response regulator [Oligoflexales bacterium]